LALSAADRLNNVGTLVVAGGTLDLGSFGNTFAGVQQTGGTISNGTLTSSTDFDLRAGAASAVLAGAVGLVKTGSGTSTLSGTNTYSGGTTLYAGSLIINNASALGTGSVSLTNAGKLVINTTASIAGSLDWSGGSIDWKPGTVLNINQALKNTGEGGKIMISSASGLKMGANTIATFGSTNFTAGDIQITRPQNSTFNGTISILSGKVIYNVTNF